MQRTIQFSSGGLLIVFGALLLLQSLNIIPPTVNDLMWAVILGAAGGFFLYRFSQSREQWWWLIPGVALIGIGISNILEVFVPRYSAVYEDLIILGSIAVSFIAVYLTNRKLWWALIPAGVLLTIGLVSTLENSSALPAGFDTDGLFFIGLGLTFMLIYFVPTVHGQMKWAIYPGATLLIFGTFLSTENDLALWQAVGPVLLILFGGYFLIRSARNQ